jgi:hypothetical protein
MLTTAQCLHFVRAVRPFIKEKCDLTNLEGITAAMIAIRGAMADVGASVVCRIVYVTAVPTAEGLVITLPTSPNLVLEVHST